MADQNVSINFSSSADKSIAANNALIASLKALEAQFKSVQATFKSGLPDVNARVSSRTSIPSGKPAGNFDTVNKNVGTPPSFTSGLPAPRVPTTPSVPSPTVPQPTVARLPSTSGRVAASIAEIKKIKETEEAVARLGKRVSDFRPIRHIIPPAAIPPIPDASNKFSELSRRVSQSSSSVSGLGVSLRSIAGQAVAFTGLSIGAATLGNEIRKAIQAVSDLDSAMSAVAAVGGLEKTSEELSNLTKQVLDLGSKTQYGAVGAAEGLKELIAAGYSSSDASKLLADTLNLAATESMSMGRASEIMVAGLQAFGLSVSDGTRLADVLARSANASTASVDDMGEALKYAAPVSKALGVTLEETNAALAILANNGIRGGMAGRGLSSVMAKMVAPTQDAIEALSEMGMSANDLNPQIVGVETSLKRLAKLPQVQLVKMFGVENLDISNILGRNAGGFAKMNEYMVKANVSAKSMSEIRMDNLAGDIKKLGAAMTELRIELVGENYESIRDIVQDFTTYLRENKAAISENIKRVGDLAVILGKVAIGYAAVKGVNIIATLVATAVKWAAETGLIKLNTTALYDNAAARAAAANAGVGGVGGVGGGEGKGKGKGKGKSGGKSTTPPAGGKGGSKGGDPFILGSVGAIGGGMLGAELAPDDAGPIAKTAFTIGGAIIGHNIQRGIIQVAKPLMAAGIASLKGGAITSASVAAGARLVANMAVGAAARANILGAVIIAASKYAIGNIEEYRDISKDTFDTINDYGNTALSTSRRMVGEAANGNELDKTKARILQEINGIQQQINDAAENGGTYSEEQVENLKLTRQALGQIYDNAEKINRNRQNQLAIEREIAANNQRAVSAEEQRAKLSSETAKNALQTAKGLDAAKGLDLSAGLGASGSLRGNNGEDATASVMPSASLTDSEKKGLQEDIAKEQAEIAAAMKLTGEAGQAQARELAKKKVSENLGISLNERNGEVNPLGSGPRQLGSGAVAMNQLFGRSSNSGLLEAAKEQNKYLRQLVELAKIKESVKYVATIA